MFCKKGFLRNFSKFTGKHLCQRLFFKVRDSFLKLKSLWHRCFPVNFAKFLRTPFLQNTSGGCFCLLKWYSRPFSLCIPFLGEHVISFVASDTQLGIALQINGESSYSTPVGPNIVTDLIVSSTPTIAAINTKIRQIANLVRTQKANAYLSELNRLAFLGRVNQLQQRLQQSVIPIPQYCSNGIQLNVMVARYCNQIIKRSHLLTKGS